jgi:hypothetical protein
MVPMPVNHEYSTPAVFEEWPTRENGEPLKLGEIIQASAAARSAVFRIVDEAAELRRGSRTYYINGWAGRPAPQAVRLPLPIRSAPH